jgi:aminoglycoside phosphotransferase family enzyme
MNREAVLELAQHGRFPEGAAAFTLVETHISWVLLSDTDVYKIKKPVVFSFLDFSTPELRQHFCEEELRLNRRLAPDMYLGVCPVVRDADGRMAVCLEGRGEVVDHALHMRRMDDSRQMDRVLRQGGVRLQDMDQLAGLLAAFHRQYVQPNPPFGDLDNRSDVDDLFGMSDLAEVWIGQGAAQTLQHWAAVLHRFLDVHAGRFRDRAAAGFWVEGHGDLHARNIFLLEGGPVVFDCIEFSAHFRVLDVLSDLAFLCMDLEAAGHPELSERFLQTYVGHWNCMPAIEDGLILVYFKAYRASVRLKVNLLSLQQQSDDRLVQEARTYWDVVGDYVARLARKG